MADITRLTWKGKWEDSEPDDWETWELWSHGTEAGDYRPTSLADLASVLAGLSDEELAEMGGKRKQLPQSLFRDTKGRVTPFGTYIVLRVDGEETP